MVVFYQQPNYERFQVASDECTISRKTDSLYRRKRREQSMLHVKRVTLELRIPEGISLQGRCVKGARARVLPFPTNRTRHLRSHGRDEVEACGGPSLAVVSAARFSEIASR